MKRIVAAAVTLVCMTQGLAAAASPPTAPVVRGRPTAIIDVSRIDLSGPRGRRQLRRKVASAVEAVCGSYFAATADEEDRITLCRRNAFADLSPSMTAIVARRGAARYDIASRS